MTNDRRDKLKLSQIRVLVEVANCGSFSEAAYRLEMSQSSVSHAISTLEAEMGVNLFSRGRFGATPTPVGEEIIARARQILYLLDDIIKQADLSKGLRGGQVRISTFRSAATHILPDAIALFCHRYPAVAIRIFEHDDRAEVEDDLKKGRADIGIIYLPAGEEFETWDLMRDEFVALFPKSSGLPDSKIDWKELETRGLIMAPEGDGCDAMVFAHAAKYGATLNVVYQIRSDATIVNMVAKGLGVAITPRLAAEPIPPDIRVCRLPIPLFRTISIAVLKDALLTPPAFALLELLKNQDFSEGK